MDNRKRSKEDCISYPPIENYGMIGNLRTVALSGNGSIDFMCYPLFDSPSLFARMLDYKQGGHFSITPLDSPTVKQQYIPTTNVLTTRYLSDTYSVQIDDLMHHPSQESGELYPWLIRRITVPRGKVKLKLECFPGFDYARASHTTEFFDTPNEQCKSDRVGETGVRFKSQDLSMDLRYAYDNSSEEDFSEENFSWELESRPDDQLKGPGVVGSIHLSEGQELTFIFGISPNTSDLTKYGFSSNEPTLSKPLIYSIFLETCRFWRSWSESSTYKGRWREGVIRSALTLKLLTFAPTGAIVAAPTFSLPEEIGGTRNWDYRYCWVRDSSFTIYAFIRLGFTYEAKAYMGYIEKILDNSTGGDGISIMYSIHGDSDLDEIELNHLEGYRQSSPVRIGNGAASHLQLDIYGELMDAAYLYNKFSSPISYDLWVHLRRIVNYVCANWTRKDMSIWEVRNQQQNFLYSKIMCWVAVDRGLRLADKRTFPCPDRNRWLETRDTIYEEIMAKGWNKELSMFSQSYESTDSLDASVLIMPLVFFISPTDPRFLKTVDRILLPLEKGGLVSNNLVYRYNHLYSQDGVAGTEGSFAMCTFWLVEALIRTGAYDPKYIPPALVIFEQMLSYGNHLQLFSEEIAPSSEFLGNFPQAFTHIALISAAFNLDRVLK